MVLFNLPQRRGNVPKQRKSANASAAQNPNGAVTQEAVETETSDVEEAELGDLAEAKSAGVSEEQGVSQQAPIISESMLKLLREEDRLPALLAQPIAGLKPRAEARRRSRMLRNQNRWRHGAPLVVPVITACIGGATAMFMSKYGTSSPIVSTLEAGGMVGSGVFVTQKIRQIVRRELERRQNDAESESAELPKTEEKLP